MHFVVATPYYNSNHDKYVQYKIQQASPEMHFLMKKVGPIKVYGN